MRKTSFKLLALAMVVLLSISLCSSCAKPTVSAPSASASASTAPSVSAAPPASTAPSEQPRTQLNVEVFDRANENGTDPTNNYWTDWIKQQMLEKYNMEVAFTSVARTEEIPQLNVLMAGGDAPDIVFTYTQSVAYNYYKQGGLADLTDLVDQYGQNLKSYLGDEILSYGEFDDKLYMIPAKRIALGMYNTFIRKDWLDKLGLPMPSTIDEFYNDLVAFKEKNPGNVENVIPYSAEASFPWRFGNIIDSFIQFSGMSDEDIFVKGVAATSSGSDLLYPGFKEGVRFLNKMYNNGLLDPEFALYPSFNEVEDVIMRGTVGAWCSNYDSPIRTSPGVYNQLKQNVPGAEIAVLDCFVNSDGKHLRQMYAPTGIYNFVPSTSKNVAGAVKYLDWLCIPEVQTYLTCGEEGINNKKDENGIPVMINLQNDPRMMNSPNNLDYALIVNGVDLGDEKKNLLAISKSYEEQYVDWFMDAYNISLHDAVVFNPLIIPTDAEAQYSNTLDDKRNEILSAAVSASEADFDKVYDAGIQDWLDTGGQACLDARQAVWDQMQK